MRPHRTRKCCPHLLHKRNLISGRVIYGYRDINVFPAPIVTPSDDDSVRQHRFLSPPTFIPHKENSRYREAFLLPPTTEAPFLAFKCNSCPCVFSDPEEIRIHEEAHAMNPTMWIRLVLEKINSFVFTHAWDFPNSLFLVSTYKVKSSSRVIYSVVRWQGRDEEDWFL